MSVDQHAVIVSLFQPRFHFGVEVAEERADVTVSLDFEVTFHSVAMPVQIAAFVLQGFVTVSCVELVLLLNDHGISFAGPVSTARYHEKLTGANRDYHQS